MFALYDRITPEEVRQVAARTWSERRPAEAADAGIEPAHAEVICSDSVGQCCCPSVVQVQTDIRTGLGEHRLDPTRGCRARRIGQRELIGKFGPETFEDLIIDISLFRPGPVKSDMISPFLLARLAIIDPELSYELPPALTASTGLDALTQLIEPYVSPRATA